MGKVPLVERLCRKFVSALCVHRTHNVCIFFLTRTLDSSKVDTSTGVHKYIDDGKKKKKQYQQQREFEF